MSQVCHGHSQTGQQIHQSQNQAPHKGVAKDEYTDVLRNHFIPEGNRMLAHAGKWANNNNNL